MTRSGWLFNAFSKSDPCTVISGPPGTGKSQVVVSLLLNAWARGQTVLFASNNNKAVDVVRERVERFESEFPIAVRAGAKQKQNIQEVLRRTLNMASVSNGGGSANVDVEELRRKRQKLLEERSELQGALESKLPQRIDEARKTALGAYGEYLSTLASMADEERALEVEKAELGFEDTGFAKIEAAVNDTVAWLQRISYFKDLIARDNKRRQNCRTTSSIESVIGTEPPRKSASPPGKQGIGSGCSLGQAPSS